MNEIFAECRALTAAIREKTGALVGVSVEQGLFAVTSTTKDGRKYATSQLTDWQTHAACVEYMRKMVA